jgi:hypothetical protein
MKVSATLQKCNIMYPGGGSMSSVLRRVNQSHQFAYVDRRDQFLAMPRLAQVAPKIAHIVQAIKGGGAGIAFVYSFFLEHGLIPMALALEHAGFVRVDGPPVGAGLSSKAGGSGNRGGGYIILAPEMSKNIAESIAMINSPDNARGQRIRVVLGSSSVSEGMDLKCIRHVHVLEPWYNMNRIEQVIGRAVRRNSHASMPPKDRDVTVWLHAVALQESLESPDQHLYRVALEKQRVIHDVEAVLKEAAFDRQLLQKNNNNNNGKDAVDASTFRARHVTEVLPLYVHLIGRAMQKVAATNGVTLAALKAALSTPDPVDDETLYQVLSGLIADRTPLGPAGEYIEFNARTGVYSLSKPDSSGHHQAATTTDGTAAGAWHVLKLKQANNNKKMKHASQ